MAKKNNSQNKPYYSQRNNVLKPNGACNVTSMINALSSAGWPVDKLGTKKYPQPEDALMNFMMNDNTVQVAWKQIDPAGNYPPNEWHAILALGTNLWLRSNELLCHHKSAVEFRENVTAEDIIKTIDDGGAVVCSGCFVTAGKKTLGHVVCVVGYENTDDEITFILDDSWGDYHDGYATPKGDDIRMSFSDFQKLLRPCGALKKMGHIVSMFKEC